MASQLIELTFQSATSYDDPFNEIRLDVTFADPNNDRITVPAFWAGADVWKVRYSSNIVGEHKLITKCSDTNNLGLHKQEDKIEVTEYEGDNPLWLHGAPVVAEDNRHFCHADGKPFFWLGDTWWLGLTKRLSLANFKTLTEDRKEKAFTVVQLVAGLYPDMTAFDERGASESGFPWLADFASINPAFFDEADDRIMHLVSQGIAPCILGCWGYHLPLLGIKKMKQHWRYIMARWAALPVVWAASGEQTMAWYLTKNKTAQSQSLKREWTKVTSYIKDLNSFNRMITAHPHQSARDSVEAPDLLDFEMQQTGHDNPTKKHAALALSGWKAKPTMPVISGESRYEALEITPKVTTADTRQAFWAHLLNSGCAGHTYGANGIWQVNRDNDPFGDSPGGNNWGNITWVEAMQLPGAKQLSEAKEILSEYPWHELNPMMVKQKWHHHATGPFKQFPIAAASTEDLSLVIYYLIGLKPFIINMSQFTQPMLADWFDPTSGETAVLTKELITNAGSRAFKPPGKNHDGDEDWVLILKQESD